MNTIRTTPTDAELAALREQGPSAAFGFCLITQHRPELGPQVCLLEAAHQVLGGWAVHLVATQEEMSARWDRLARLGEGTRHSYHVLRNGADQVPVYDPSKRGATGRPIPTRSITVSR